MLRRFAPLALMLLIAPATAQPQAEQIEVILANFSFTPDTIQLHHGQAYVLHIVNQSGGGHNFAAPAFFAAAAIAAEDRGKIEKGRIEFDGGESVDVHFTAPAAGSYEIHCTHFLHTSFGMSGKFVVS